MALDLTHEFPRSAFEELNGFAWLPRLIDKVRAGHAGKMGEYSPYPCPGDKGFLKAFGVDAEALKQQILSGADEAAIGAWVQANAKDPSEATKQRYRLGHHKSPNLLMTIAVVIFRWPLRHLIAQRSPGVALSSLDTFAKMTAAEEGHPIPPAPAGL